jgi:DNA-directed RNA polymerase specialized sigma24 family protein
MNRDLFWTFLEAEHAKAEAFCRKLAGNREDGDDLYQDALLAAMRKFRTLRDPKAFRPWQRRFRCIGPLTRESDDGHQLSV